MKSVAQFLFTALAIWTVDTTPANADQGHLRLTRASPLAFLCSYDIAINKKTVTKLSARGSVDVQFELLPKNTISARVNKDMALCFSCTVEKNFSIDPGIILKINIIPDIFSLKACPKIIFEGETVGSNILSISLKPSTFLQQSSVEDVRAMPGVRTKFKTSRTIDYSVSLTTSAEFESKIGSDVDLLTAEIRGRLVRTIAGSLRQSETKEREVEVDGSVAPRVRLIWVDRIRRGTATIVAGGDVLTVPFEIQTGSELKVINLR